MILSRKKKKKRSLRFDPMEPNMGLLVELRRQRSTLEALAEKTGLPRYTLSRILNGRRLATVSEQGRIADALGVRVEQVFHPRHTWKERPEPTGPNLELMDEMRRQGIIPRVLARKTGVSWYFLDRILNGSRSATLEEQQEIARVLGVPVSRIFKPQKEEE